ncbi:hypothetical protein TUM3794_20820 [Shewanella colwelliana]|uniref:ABC transmembrane type-1 domain-containing protein n=2 Tax=Shewanella colwelliana TaxID=23 RepID=A0ABQ4P0R9_SHECO|nr:hypothetical protein TUM3794_20820 [Shewanella colwelliana]
MAKKTFILYLICSVIIILLTDYLTIQFAFMRESPWYQIIWAIIAMLPYLLAPIGAISFIRMRLKSVAGLKYDEITKYDTVAAAAIYAAMVLVVLLSAASPYKPLFLSLLVFAGYRLYAITAPIKTQQDYFDSLINRRKTTFLDFVKYVKVHKGGTDVGALKRAYTELTKKVKVKSYVIVGALALMFVLPFLSINLLVLSPLLMLFAVPLWYSQFMLRLKIRDIESMINFDSYQDVQAIDDALDAAVAV